MKYAFFLLLLMPICVAAQPMPAALDAELATNEIWANGSAFRYAETDTAAANLRPLLDSAKATVETFFGAPFSDPLKFTVVPDREAFSAVLREAWGVPETACWMVATGVADFVVVLSPAQWDEEACEHDPGNTQHVLDIITHELTHAYHGQRNPTRDFTGAEELGWFLEGLAVLVADQLNRDLASPAEAVASGAAPVRLADAWSGMYRYGVSGSLVQYIDEQYGRAVVLELLAATAQEELLARLGLEEATLLNRWKLWVESR